MLPVAKPRLFTVSLFATLCISLAAAARAYCPFCAAESRTLSEEIDTSDVSVLARLAGRVAAAGVIRFPNPMGLPSPD